MHNRKKDNNTFQTKPAASLVPDSFYVTHHSGQCYTSNLPFCPLSTENCVTAYFSITLLLFFSLVLSAPSNFSLDFCSHISRLVIFASLNMEQLQQQQRRRQFDSSQLDMDDDDSG